MKYALTCVACLLVTAFYSFAQLPATEIWMSNVTIAGGKMNFTKPVLISGKNAYNDEPVFSPDAKFIFYTSHSDSLGHTEIYKYQMKTKTSALFTSSADAKHAPLMMPDGKNVSFIVAEGGEHHRLWKMPVVGGNSEPIMKEKDSIGNYCWMSGDSVALQILSSPPSLQAASTGTGVSKVVAHDVGYTIKRMPANLPMPGKWEDCWIFSGKSKEGDHVFQSFVYGKKGKLTVMPLCPGCSLMPGADNFTLIRNGFFSAKGSKIYLIDDGSAEGWTEVADLSKYGIKNIKSITFSTDEKKILIVSVK